MGIFDDGETIYDLGAEDLDDDTDPTGPGFTELAPGAAALDGPVPLSGAIPLPAFKEEVTARLNVSAELMPEVVRIIEERCTETQTAALGAMVDAMLIEGIDERVAARTMASALQLIADRKRLAAVGIMTTRPGIVSA